MDYILPTFYGFILFVLVFGVSIGHLFNLIKGKDKISQIYESSENYIQLASIQVFNAVFLLMVFIGFWLMLKDEGSGTFNGIMMAPFFIIYVLVVIFVERKIDKLPRMKKHR